MNLSADQIISQLQNQIADYAKMLAVSNATVDICKASINELNQKISELEKELSKCEVNEKLDN